MEFIDVYGSLTGLGIATLLIGGAFAILNAWALIVVIVAGHRYLDRTRGTSPRDQLEKYEQGLERKRRAANEERLNQSPGERRAARPVDR
ncbi:hypothetical protein [Curtobacterium sp. Curtsp57]|uniref:hypothetical protein n=1 Tax=Curtobacterium sp. Curtsp57 TaxID=3243047 RepID=UPI0039B58123